MVQCVPMNRTMKAYLKRAQQIIGKRTPAEMRYDNTVIDGLAKGMDIQSAIAVANLEHPRQTLMPKSDQWADVAAHYEYLLDHEKILKQSETI
jgi:hypothetical protein